VTQNPIQYEIVGDPAPATTDTTTSTTTFPATSTNYPDLTFIVNQGFRCDGLGYCWQTASPSYFGTFKYKEEPVCTATTGDWSNNEITCYLDYDYEY